MMHPRRWWLAGLMAVVASLALPAAAAIERARPEEARALLAKALAHIKAVGRDRAFRDFMDRRGPWIDRDLYVTVYDFGGKTLAHGADPREVGRRNLARKDANGKLFIRERLDIAWASGKGRQEYDLLNPLTRQVEAKLMFFERLNDLVVACGAYRPE